jgi:hypothetical protein
VNRQMAGAGLVLLTVAAAPLLYGQRQSYSGTYAEHFEFSEFAGCYLTFTPSAWAKYRAVVPETFDRQRAKLDFVGRGTARLRDFKPGDRRGYGHMGMYPCQIEVIDLRTAKPLPSFR